MGGNSEVVGTAWHRCQVMYTIHMYERYTSYGWFYFSACLHSVCFFSPDLNQENALKAT